MVFMGKVLGMRVFQRVLTKTVSIAQLKSQKYLTEKKRVGFLFQRSWTFLDFLQIEQNFSSE